SRPLPRLRRSRLPARVASRAGAGGRPAGISVRPGARRRRGRGAAAVARPRRPDAAPLGGARRGRLLRNLLLRLGHTVLSPPARLGPRRPDTDAPRTQALLVLAGMGARAAAATPAHSRRGDRQHASVRV